MRTRLVTTASGASNDAVADRISTLMALLPEIIGSRSRHLSELAAVDVELEQLHRIAAQDVALGVLAQEGQVVDRARQVEVPVRIARRVRATGFPP